MEGVVDGLVTMDRFQLILGSSLAALAILFASKFFKNDASYRRMLEDRKKLQSFEVGSATENSGAPRRSVKDLVAFYDSEIRTLYQMFNKVAATTPDRPALGVRSKTGGTVGDYQWQTFAQVKVMRDNLASAFLHLGHKSDEPIGLYSINRPEWMIGDLACSAVRCPSVALYDTLGKNAMEYVINHAELKTVMCGAKQLTNMLAAVPNVPVLKIIICMDSVTSTQVEQAKALGIRLVGWEEALQLGAQNPGDQVAPRAEDIYTIMYTSGTTGNPKGVILSHGNIIAVLSGVRHHPSGLIGENDVHMSYLPLAHSFERVVSYTVISFASSVGYYQGNINELFADINVLRPTFLVGAPRVWSRLYDKLTLTMENGPAYKKKLFNWGFKAKQAALRKGESTLFWDKILFNKTKARLGGRVRHITSGSAPLDPKLAEFLKICFCCQVVEGYGLTENTAVASCAQMSDSLFGHTGAPIECLEIKLLDVPEMGYSSKNSPPTGEVLMRGYNVFRGYYKDPQLTKEALEPNGWFHTGDIGRWNPNGTLSIVDRRKNIFKLAQGEYVAVEYLEGIYVRSKYVQQIWVYGDSFKRYLVAFVYPDPEVAAAWAKANGVSADMKSLTESEKFKAVILEDLTRNAKDSKLHGFEFVKAILLVSEPYSQDNECMTPSFKLRRPQLLKKHQAEIDALYQQIGE